MMRLGLMLLGLGLMRLGLMLVVVMVMVRVRVRVRMSRPAAWRDVGVSRCRRRLLLLRGVVLAWVSWLLTVVEVGRDSSGGVGGEVDMPSLPSSSSAGGVVGGAGVGTLGSGSNTGFRR
jgi:hypothetical protein